MSQSRDETRHHRSLIRRSILYGTHRLLFSLDFGEACCDKRGIMSGLLGDVWHISSAIKVDPTCTREISSVASLAPLRMRRKPILRSAFVIGALVLTNGPSGHGSEPTPAEVFDQRIMPIFRSQDPSSCVQCHLSSVDLKEYILPSSEATFASLRDQGLCQSGRSWKVEDSGN